MSLLSVRELKVAFPTAGGVVQAVRDVSFEIQPGETVGLVGESGCGKSTLGRAIMRLVPADGGQIMLQSRDLTLMSREEMRPLMQMIFQDPYGSINPRHSIGKTIGQPLALAGWTRDKIDARVRELLQQVSLPAAAAERFPHEFSGGQRQRIGIARALALHPKLLICDEPVSALDVSVRAQIINLLNDLQSELGVSYLFISHDLSVVHHVCDRVLVMYLGRLVEVGDTETLWRQPAHPYTLALLSAAPIADPRLRTTRQRKVLQGELPSPLHPPSGCAFHSRCQFAQARCRSEQPELRKLPGGQQVACHFDLVTHAAEAMPHAEPQAGRPALETVDGGGGSRPLSHSLSEEPSMAELKNLGDLVDRTLDPGRLALVDLYDSAAPREYSHGDMDLLSGGVAQWLTSRGLTRGARVAILALNRAEYIAAYFGIMRAGMVAVPVNIKLPSETIAHVLKDAGVSLAFVDTACRQLVAQAVPIIDFDDAGPDGFAALVRPATFESVVPQHDEVAQILYTSGSTGMPKGVPLTHAGQLWALCKPLLPGAKDERQIVAQPLFHMNGLMTTKGVFRAGASMVLMPAFDTHAYMEALARYRITSVMAVPTMFARVIKEMEGRKYIDLSSLRRIHLGSAPITVTMLERIQQAIPSAIILIGYGTTEGGPSPFGPHPDGRTPPPLALGVQVPGSEVKLVDGPDANQGVLVMRNPAVMTGYLNLPAKSAQVLDDGWYYSGDVMRRDADGYFYFIGRADDMFVCSGENIYPGEVEKMLERHPAIQQAIVLPLPDEERSHVPVAFIVPRSGTAPTTEEIKRFSIENGPAYQHPRRIAFLSEMPWAGTNKIDRNALARRASELEAAQGWSK